MIDAVCASPPWLSSDAAPFCCRLCARWACSRLSLVVRLSRTKQAKRGLRGQPCGKPSSWSIVLGSRLSSKYHDFVVFLVSRSYSGMSDAVASLSASMVRAAVLEVLLNMLCRSNMMRPRLGGVGSGLLDCWSGRWMYVSTSAAVVWATKSTPPETWMPYWPPFRRMGVIALAVWTSAAFAATRRHAVPMPIGRSRSKWEGSLWRARK